MHLSLRLGGTPILGQYGYVPRESPLFSALAAPKDSTFSTRAARKDPLFQKYMPSFVIFSSKILFALKAPPPFSVRGRSLTPPPPFVNPARHIFTTLILEYSPPPLGSLRWAHMSIFRFSRARAKFNLSAFMSLLCRR